MLAGQCFGCAVPRACGFPDVVLPSAACPARNARSRTPLPLVFGVSPVIVKLPGGSQRLRLSDPSLNKTTPGVIASTLRVRETSQLIRRQTVVYQRIARFDKRCCNDSLRNTHVNKKNAL